MKLIEEKIASLRLEVSDIMNSNLQSTSRGRLSQMRMSPIEEGGEQQLQKKLNFQFTATQIKRMQNKHA